ncbi:C-type lectin domain family 5 member A-like [Columba livia]|uniref:C-type lectin domain family 5 member A-like n=1 Tax=Columba livia TaxID=8932 RepID=A0A2I0MKJ4_COLLI|nr:C-type lectin domain family 5 member A-like isoform X1 [Columba livia]PKK30199.1 C-type lectin domain family 5 member A-like [Columba livia]
MPENLIYADLNLTESTSSRLQVTDVQDSTYAEVKVQSLDTNAAADYTSPGKNCCSRTCVAVLAAVITLLLVLAVCLILLYHPTASSPPDSKIFCTTCEDELVTRGLVLATETGRNPLWSGERYKQDRTGCPQGWEKNREKCYFFFPKPQKNDWNASRKECRDKESDLVIIENKEELDYLRSQSRGHYYLLGLTYSEREKKWKWINNMEHCTDMFTIGGDHTDYFCAVIGHGEVATAHCNGTSTTQNMCEKAANISRS